jgi:hypothetical protein
MASAALARALAVRVIGTPTIGGSIAAASLPAAWAWGRGPRLGGGRWQGERQARGE